MCEGEVSQVSKIAFIMGLLSDKASAWALAVSDSNFPLCSSFLLFTAGGQGKEASSRLLSLGKDPAQSPSTP